jgi:hypothetical protein
MSVNNRPKDKFMITQMLKWKVASDVAMIRLFCWIFGMMTILMMVLGIRKISELSLTEAQLYLAVSILLVLFFQCVIVGLLFNNKRKAA